MKFLQIILIVVGGICTLALPTCADLVVFHNGDFRYGDVVKDASGNITITYPDGRSDQFSQYQVRSVHAGVQKPAPGEILSVSDFTMAATAEIYSITGNITQSKTMKNHDGKEFELDVQEEYDVPAMQVYPTRHAFFNRPGVYLVLRLNNNTDQTVQSATFRVFLYNNQKQLLSTKDFLVHRLPPTTPEGRGGRVIDVDVPDVRYEQVGRIRVVRRH